MKLTSHNGRVDSSGLHNDRNYDVNLSPHIDQEKMNENKYWTYNGVKDKPLNEIELEFYKEHFSEYLNQRNEYNIKDGHRKRNRTMTQFFKGAQTRPEDKIIQIGKKDDHIDPELLWECAMEYQKQFDEIFGSNCKILDISLHVDEETPHLHIRRVWMYKDDDGVERVGQTRALQEMGILRQDTSREEGRYNNAKITFTNQDRELFRNICREKNIDLEKDSNIKRKHLSVPEYKELQGEIEELELKRTAIRREIEKAEEEATELTKSCDAIESFLTSPLFYNIHDEEVAHARKRNLNQRVIALTKMFRDEAERIEASEGSFRKLMEDAYFESKETKLQRDVSSLESKVEMLSKFIEEEGLTKKYKEFEKNSNPRQDNSPHRTV